MAGDIKRQRKSWTLQDRSKVSINILRANLAEEGDEDAQLDVAKRLLEENSGPGVSPRTQNENVRLALYWLIKSSEQGNDEATQLLKECLQSGRGLTAQNILDVRTCVSTPKYEKLTFKAARLLHRKLSNGEEFITTPQLLSRVNMSMKNVTFEEHSNGSVVHDEIFPDEDNAGNLEEHVDQEEEPTDRNSSNSIPPEGAQRALPTRELNSTFIVGSSQKQNQAGTNTPSLSPSTPHSPTKQSPTKSVQNSSPNNHLRKAATPVEQEHKSDLKLAMKQSGKKLTLNDLLNVAKDFNLGNSPKVSVDERNRILDRHVWTASSSVNTFSLQLLVLAVVGNVMVLSEALHYLIYLGCIWSSYNFLTWRLRYKNFNDWKHAFSSVLQGDSWETDKFRTRLSTQYLMPPLIKVLFGLLFLAFANGGQVTFMFVAVGITLITSIQIGVFRSVILGWRQILLISLTLSYQQFPSIINILGENFAEQSKLLHKSLTSLEKFQIQAHFPFPINVFTLLTCLILVTTVKWSLDRILSETLPQMVLSLWLVRIVQAYSILEADQFVTGVCAGLVIVVIMGLVCSKLDTWKVVLVTLYVMLIAIGTGWTFAQYKNKVVGVGEEEVVFLDWEEYETSCHRKAWAVESPAATQIKCSDLYGGEGDQTWVKWKGKITIVKVEELTRGTMGWEDVVLDISVGIFSGHNGDDGSRNWQNFLSSSNDAGEALAPASVIVNTAGLGDKRRKQNLVDHILNFRSGDRIEFIGRLKGDSVGSLKPQIIDVRSLQCISCATADYGEFIVGNKNKYEFGWIGERWSSHEQINGYEFLNEWKQILRNLYDSLRSVLRMGRME